MNVPKHTALAGLHIDTEGKVHLAQTTASGGREASVAEPFRPFAWAPESDEPLKGDGVLKGLQRFDSPEAFGQAVKENAPSNQKAHYSDPNPIDQRARLPPSAERGLRGFQYAGMFAAALRKALAPALEALPLTRMSAVRTPL